MKPFNLKKALAGHPLVTRDGLEASNFRKDPSGDGFRCDHGGDWSYHDATGAAPFWKSKDLFLAASPIPSKPRPKSETRKNVERVRVIMNRGNWMTLDRIGEDLHSRYGVNLPEQSVSARVRDLRKNEFGAYDIRKKAIGKGLYAYKNFGKKGAA